MLHLAVGLVAWLVTAPGDEAVGRRPYELDWAGRVNDTHPPLVDFEDLTGWTVETKASEASFGRTREQQIFGQYVGKLVYRGTAGGPQVTLRPPRPVPLPANLDALHCWVYGNNWGYAPRSDTPPVTVQALLRSAAGDEVTVNLAYVNWEEWFLCHERLSPQQVSQLATGGSFVGLRVNGGRNKEDRTLYFDSLCAFREEFGPLTFEPRPSRNLAPLPGQTVGTNRGPGTLPFPTTPDTITPPTLAPGATTEIRREGETWVFAYRGADGQLTWRYEPRRGTLDDLSLTWAGAPPVQPSVGGGCWLATPQGPQPAEAAVLRSSERQGDAVVTRWTLRRGELTVEATFQMRLRGKSLLLDVLAPGGQVAEVRYGQAAGLVNPRLVTTPYYPAHGGRPAIVVSGPPERPLFLTGNTDWYQGNGAEPFAAPAIEGERVSYNGGVRYLPNTDGRRNDCVERLILSASPRYEELLPTIPNPVSPYKAVTGTHVWIAHGAGDRERDAAYWRNIKRWGLSEIVITDHETGWRDGGESFTFRTRPAPGKGGDEGQQRYARIMQDELGFVYGPYNNYTDFAPVNEYWSTDLIGRTSSNQLQGAWMRCYAPKPTRAVEYCARLAPIIQQKFKFSTAYCDVHTAVAPWHRVDYDARVPGAGSYSAVFYLYGEIMLHQKKAWGGPVYSEGNHHSFYSGLTDGNYAQDQAYRIFENPWLVDFDLRRMHDLCCNFGMGNPEMFYSNVPNTGQTPAARDAYYDRFLCATLAFGHPGFFVTSGGLRNGLRSYHLVQPIAARYTQVAADQIRYLSAAGEWLESTAAVATGAYRRNQLAVRYADGTQIVANGSPTERLIAKVGERALDLPPNGFEGWTADGQISLASSDPHGWRSDYAVSPANLYVDGRGRFQRYAKAAGNGAGVCRKLDAGWEVLLWEQAECGFAVDAGRAEALDQAGQPIGPAELRRARGLTYVRPVDKAFSYRLTGQAPAGPALTCDRDEVFAGEALTVRRAQEHAVNIPPTAKPGERLWFQFEGAWIDFTVVPIAEQVDALIGHALQISLRSNLPREAEFTATCDGRSGRVTLPAGGTGVASIELGPPPAEDERLMRLTVAAAGLQQSRELALVAAKGYQELLPLPQELVARLRLRDGRELPAPAMGGHVNRQEGTSGDVTRLGLFMHPPYQGGTGQARATYAAVTLPATPAACRAYVGKGDGSDPGDGILYQMLVRDAAGSETKVAEVTVTKHAWSPISGDLSRWAGQPVQLVLVADVGPEDNSSGDWACWGDIRVESRDELLVRRLDPATERYRREPGPYPLAGLTRAQVQSAQRAWLRFDGMGLDSGQRYFLEASLNGREVGRLPAAGGNETAGVWAERVGLELPREAIAELQARNRLQLRNDSGDWFKVRRFWIELLLPDGRRASSDISVCAYTQPPNWPYAEGIGVPHGQLIEPTIWFSLP
ncbi:MAG: hypothetical protein IT204_00720 [Fimbriimonadaceae bacterium]|nr:hypothetical protein [Fimbriimonadaceae bacterium]